MICFFWMKIIAMLHKYDITDEIRKYEKYKKAPFNAFQRLNQGSELWRDLFGLGYSDWLTVEEFNNLTILFQKRHILSHNEGIVDEKYLSNSNDTRYKTGQRIVVSKNDIFMLIESLEKIINEIDKVLIDIDK